jgi:hypothetical protein
MCNLLSNTIRIDMIVIGSGGMFVSMDDNIKSKVTQNLSELPEIGNVCKCLKFLPTIDRK